jgi:hypothetical protein
MAAGQTLIGFSVSGGSQAILVRGVGPTLASFGLGGTMVDPRLELFNGSARDRKRGLKQCGAQQCFRQRRCLLVTNSQDAAFMQPIDGTRSVHLKGTGAGVAPWGSTIPFRQHAAARECFGPQPGGHGRQHLDLGFFVDGTGARMF